MDSLKVMILGVQKYQFTDEKTQKEVKGTTVHYVQLTQSNEDDKKGLFPAKASLPYEQFAQFHGMEFPLLGEAGITFDLSNKRNPIKVTGFKVTDHVVID